MIPITHIWLSTAPMDMRCGSGKLLAHIITQHQGIRPHCAYLFYNKTGTRLNEPPRDCRRPNILREYNDENTTLHPRD